MRQDVAGGGGHQRRGHLIDTGRKRGGIRWAVAQRGQDLGAALAAVGGQIGKAGQRILDGFAMGGQKAAKSLLICSEPRRRDKAEHVHHHQLVL